MYLFQCYSTWVGNCILLFLFFVCFFFSAPRKKPHLKLVWLVSWTLRLLWTSKKSKITQKPSVCVCSLKVFCLSNLFLNQQMPVALMLFMEVNPFHVEQSGNTSVSCSTCWPVLFSDSVSFLEASDQGWSQSNLHQLSILAKGPKWQKDCPQDAEVFSPYMMYVCMCVCMYTSVILYII